MGVNRGKQFELVVNDSFSRIPNASIDRLYDTTNGFAGVFNICDYIVFVSPHQYYFECKTTYGNTLNFKGAISAGQYEGLLEKSKIPGVHAGLIVWFMDHDKTVYVPIESIRKEKAKGAKSLNVHNLEDVDDVVHIEAKKKRIFFDYNMAKLIQDLSEVDTNG